MTTVQLGLTTQQIYDLDNSMVAAQNATLGTTVSSMMIQLTRAPIGDTDSYISSYNGAVSGVSYTIDTDQAFMDDEAEFLAVVCSLAGSPVANHFMSTATISGSVVTIEQWQLSSGSIIASGSAGDFAPISILMYGAKPGQVD